MANPARAKLCELYLWDGYEGYGFSLHASQGKVGQIIDEVDPDSPAHAGGLRNHDFLVEVNGYNVLSEPHLAVVARIKANPNRLCLLVVDAKNKKYFDEQHIVIDSYMSELDRFQCPPSRPTPSTEETAPTLKKREEDIGTIAANQYTFILNELEQKNSERLARNPEESCCEVVTNEPSNPFDENEVVEQPVDPAVSTPSLSNSHLQNEDVQSEEMMTKNLEWLASEEPETVLELNELVTQCDIEEKSCEPPVSPSQLEKQSGVMQPSSPTEKAEFEEVEIEPRDEVDQEINIEQEEKESVLKQVESNVIHYDSIESVTLPPLTEETDLHEVTSENHTEGEQPSLSDLDKPEETIVIEVPQLNEKTTVHSIPSDHEEKISSVPKSPDREPLKQMNGVNALDLETDLDACKLKCSRNLRKKRAPKTTYNHRKSQFDAL